MSANNQVLLDKNRTPVGNKVNTKGRIKFQNFQLNSYPWTRLLVRIIRVLKRQFFRMITRVFDNSNLSQEIFAVDT